MLGANSIQKELQLCGLPPESPKRKKADFVAPNEGGSGGNRVAYAAGTTCCLRKGLVEPPVILTGDEGQ